MIKDNVLLTVKFATIVAVKSILSQNANLRPGLTQTGQEGLSLNHINVAECGHNKKVDCVEYSQEESGESDSESKGIKDLTDQVQSLFYH